MDLSSLNKESLKTPRLTKPVVMKKINIESNKKSNSWYLNIILFIFFVVFMFFFLYGCKDNYVPVPYYV